MIKWQHKLQIKNSFWSNMKSTQLYVNKNIFQSFKIEISKWFTDLITDTYFDTNIQYCVCFIKDVETSLNTACITNVLQ